MSSCRDSFCIFLWLLPYVVSITKVTHVECRSRWSFRLVRALPTASLTAFSAVSCDWQSPLSEFSQMMTLCLARFMVPWWSLVLILQRFWEFLFHTHIISLSGTMNGPTVFLVMISILFLSHSRVMDSKSEWRKFVFSDHVWTRFR